MNSGMPSMFISPQKVSCDFAVAATVTEYPGEPQREQYDDAHYGGDHQGVLERDPYRERDSEYEAGLQRGYQGDCRHLAQGESRSARSAW